MDKYYALIEGVNFELNIDGDKQDAGFFTTFYFEGSYKYKKDVLDYLIGLLKERVENNKSIVSVKCGSYFLVKELNLLEEFPGEAMIDNGFSFYRKSKIQVISGFFLFYAKNILIFIKVLDGLKKPIML